MAIHIHHTWPMSLWGARKGGDQEFPEWDVPDAEGGALREGRKVTKTAKKKKGGPDGGFFFPIGFAFTSNESLEGGLKSQCITPESKGGNEERLEEGKEPKNTSYRFAQELDEIEERERGG